MKFLFSIFFLTSIHIAQIAASDVVVSRVNLESNVCPGQQYTVNSIQIQSRSSHLLTSWNHINNTEEWSGLQHSYSFYNHGTINQHSACKDYEIILVKKIGDWDRSHAVGIEADISNQQIAFGDLQSVNLLIYLDNQNSYFPNLDEIKKSYSAIVTGKALSSIEQQSWDFVISLIAEPEISDQQRHFALDYHISIRPFMEPGRWFELAIPLGKMFAYTEKDYEETPVNGRQYLDRKISSIRINPETTSGKVARHSNPSAWNKDRRPDELFKEMGIRIRSLQLLRK